MKLLILGHRGQLGWELVRQGTALGYSIQGVDLPELDITDSASLRASVNVSDADIVINAAAYTAVDRAEAESVAAFASNCVAVTNLADLCACRALPCIHISTDYVFDGTASTPYREDDPIAPLGVYGQSKAEGEEALRRQLNHHIIIRTAWLYGVHGNNFVKTMLRLGSERETLRVVADQHGSPTFAADLAAAILTICGHIGQKAATVPWGTYHYCGQGVTSWHGFAREIIEQARSYTTLKTTSVEAITSAEYPTPARRPAYSVLDCNRIQAAFGIQTKAWRSSLAEMLRRYFTAQPENLQPLSRSKNS